MDLKRIKNSLRLENCILAVIFLLPVYLVRFPGINLLDILILLVFSSWIYLAKDKKKIAWQIITQNKLFSVGLGLIILGLGAGLLKTGDSVASLGIIKSWFVFPLILAFLFKVGVSREKKEALFSIIFYSAFIVSILSGVALFTHGLTYDGRLAGIFNSPNYLFMYLASGIISGTFILRRSISSKMTSKVALHGAILLCIFIVAILTKSYAGMLALLIAEVFIFQKIFNRRIYFLAILALIFIVLIFFERNSDKFQDIAGLSERSSVASRIMIWESSWKIIEDSWLWGIGEADFQSRYLEYQKFFPPYLEWAVPHPHNIFLSFWLSAGLFGLSGFIILIFNWLRVMRGKEKKLLWGASAIILYFTIHGLFDTTYFKNDLACLFWLAYSFFLELDSPDLSVVSIHKEEQALIRVEE